MEFAVVKAGHDKKQIYAVVQEDDDYVYLANGNTKPAERPKKKSRKHVQLIKNLPEEVISILSAKEEENQRIKKAVKYLNNYISR